MNLEDTLSFILLHGLLGSDIQLSHNYGSHAKASTPFLQSSTFATAVGISAAAGAAAGAAAVSPIAVECHFHM